MARIELEPCPSCGNTKLNFQTHRGTSAIRTPYYRESISCKCGLGTKIFKRPGGAVKVWNRCATRAGIIAAAAAPASTT